MTKLRIAILDDYNGLAPGHISDLLADADITIYRDTILPHPDPTPLLERLKPYDVLVTMRERTPLPAEVIAGLPQLKIVLTTGMHNRGIDLEACKARGVIVAGTPAPPPPPGAPSDFNGTVQHTWALILALVNNIPRDHALVPSGSWTHHLPLNTYIGGATLGLLGLGKLGSGVARIASLAFGMRIIAWSENLTQPRADDAAVAAGLPPGTFKYVSKTELFEQSDIVSVHLILSDRTRGIVGKDELGKMKSTGFIVNTSRGPIIDENALLDTLNRGEIRGAALDVFDVEPLPLDSKWRTTPWGQQGRAEVVFTPHTGYSFEKHLEGMWNGTAENLQRIIRGEEVIRRMA